MTVILDCVGECVLPPLQPVAPPDPFRPLLYVLRRCLKCPAIWRDPNPYYQIPREDR